MSSHNKGESFSSRGLQPSSSRLSGTALGTGFGVSLNSSFSQTTIGEEQAPSSSPPNSEEQKPSILTAAQLVENVRRVDTAQVSRDAMTASALSTFGITLDLDEFTTNEPAQSLPTKASCPVKRPAKLKSQIKIDKNRLDFFSALASTPELVMELVKHLHMTGLLSLYSVSRDFHETINGHLSHCMRACAAYQAPHSSKLFLFKFYAHLCIPDPASRPHPLIPGEIRQVPGLKWLQMVVYRERTIRDILACLARQGHRMKPGMALTLKKMWLIMDISTTAGRVQMMHNRRFFTDFDLYNIQFFVVKLDMRFNDPIDGPGTEDLRKLFLGQRSLTPLAQLLRRERFLETVEVVKLAVRYSYRVRPEHRLYPIFGIPPEEVGVGHLEGWGKGKLHLMRPDELVMVESVRRGLGLKNYILEMMTWGYVDPITGKDIDVTEEEMYMSDEEVLGTERGQIKRTAEEQKWSDYHEPEGSPDDNSEEEGMEHEGDEDEDEDEGEHNDWEDEDYENIEEN